jgi:hypothetical protein
MSTTSTRPAEPATVAADRRPLLALAGLLATVAVLLAVEAAGAAPDGTVLRGAAAWGVAAALALFGLGALVHGMLRRTDWHYPADTDRDLRIDMLRGLAIVFIVVNHTELESLFELASQETIGIVSGAELFVAMSGVVLGMVYRRRLARTDLVEVTGLLLARAWKLYRTALAVVLFVYLLSLLPGVDGRAVTTFDLGGGEVSNTYPNAERLADYPVPGYVIRDLLLLRLGPWQFNVMGLYVLLVATAPLLLAALRRRLVLVVLAVSWALYALNAVSPMNLLGAQFEDPFPLLTWQVLFVTGVALGWYRQELLAWSGRPVGKAVLAVAVVLHLGVVLLASASGFLSNGYDVRLDLLPPEAFDALYADWFTRATLDLGRLLDVFLLLATAYALLTAYWRPLDRALGWFLVPLGRASLYVFVLHVLAALVLANVPGLDGRSVALGTLAHGVVLAVLWTMVRKQVLFRVIPH